MSKEISQQEYLELRQQTIKEYVDFVNDQGEDLSADTDIILTCDDCPARFTCEFAADLYNTGGDCLAEK